MSNGVRKGRMRRAPFRSSQVGAGVGRAWMDGRRKSPREASGEKWLHPVNLGRGLCVPMADHDRRISRG